MLIFLGVEKEDELENAQKLAQKLINLRIFEDENDKMNKEDLKNCKKLSFFEFFKSDLRSAKPIPAAG